MDSYVSYHSSATGATGTAGEREADFQRLASGIGSNIQKISQNEIVEWSVGAEVGPQGIFRIGVKSMQRMVDQLRLRPEDADVRSELHKIQHYTNQLAQDTSSQLKNLQGLTLPQNPSEKRQWWIQKERLTREFSETLSSLQSLQRLAARSEKEVVERTRANSGMGKHFVRGRDQQQGRGEQLIQLESPVQSQTMMELDEEANLQMLREREQALQQIEGDIVAVNHIFKDLAVLVHDQGAVIDSIEAHIDSTHNDVQQGTQQLHQAREYQNKSRQKICCLVTFCILVVILLILVIWASH